MGRACWIPSGVGFLTGLTFVRDTGSQVIKTRAHTLTASAEWLPLPTLTLRLGYRYQLRDVTVDQIANGVPVVDGPLAAAPQPDRTTHGQGVIFDAAWRYRDLLQTSVKFVGDYFDNPYTRISPTSDNRARVQVRLTPLKWLAVSETFAITDLDNPDTQHVYAEQVLDHRALSAAHRAAHSRRQPDVFRPGPSESDVYPYQCRAHPDEFTNDSEAVSYTCRGDPDGPHSQYGPQGVCHLDAGVR